MPAFPLGVNDESRDFVTPLAALQSRQDGRTGGLAAMGRVMAARTCRVCGRAFPAGYWFAHGRCRMCQMYWRRHGAERPPAPSQFPATLRPCTHCGQVTTRLIRERCPLCYEYQRRTGHERPPRLWQRG